MEHIMPFAQILVNALTLFAKIKGINIE